MLLGGRLTGGARSGPQLIGGSNGPHQRQGPKTNHHGQKLLAQRQAPARLQACLSQGAAATAAFEPLSAFADQAGSAVTAGHGPRNVCSNFVAAVGHGSVQSEPF